MLVGLCESGGRLRGRGRVGEDLVFIPVTSFREIPVSS